MPSVFAGVPAAERDAQVKALVHFLVSEGPSLPPQALPRVGDGANGEQLYHLVGCAACHGSRRDPQETSSAIKPLGDVKAKYTLQSLADLLRDPHHIRPGGRMPSLNLSADESRHIAAYLLELPEAATIKFSYYEGNWSKLPNFAELKPLLVGGADKIHQHVANRKRDYYGLRFESTLEIAADGEYSFRLASDDGSRLTIDGRVVVDNDGVHGVVEKTGKAKLAAGLHAVVVDFFEAGGGEEVRVEYEGPGVPRRPLHDSLSYGDPSAKLKPISFEVDPALAEEGKKIFAKVGCASCHQLREGEDVLDATLKARPLAALNRERGCLAEQPRRPAIDYRLNATQRAAVKASLETAGEPRELSNQQRIAHYLTTFNCYACHDRDKRGGVEEGLNTVFQTTTKEMGDEGRIPPSLTGVGAKLTDTWMKNLLAEGGDDRPYMLTRMPKFGANNVGALRKLFAGVDTMPELPATKFTDSPRAIKQHGRRMIGSKGFSCIKCHSFGNFKATGIQSIDLQIMTRRVKKDWFLTYMQNPQVFRPRTRMPSAWPQFGPSLLPDILGGDSPTQIAAVWSYLEDGPRAKIPLGLEVKAMELVPIEEAIIYRNFIEGAGTRAIAVGYPESVHAAFDANDMRYALFWRGRFIDASRHWSGRGQGFQPPAGEHILPLPSGVQVAVLPSGDAAWPNKSAKELGYRFRGYRLSKDGRPTFMYDAAGLQISDFANTIIDDSPAQIQRRLKWTSAKPLDRWLRLAIGGQLRAADDGWFVVDGGLQIRVRGETQPRIIESAGAFELRLPLAKSGSTLIEYKW